MEHSRADVENLGSKYFVFHGDVVYEKEVEKLKADLSTDVVLLRAKANTSRERESIDYLSRLWTDFWTLWDIEKTKINPESDEVQDLPVALKESLDDIEIQTDSALLAVLAFDPGTGEPRRRLRGSCANNLCRGRRRLATDCTDRRDISRPRHRRPPAPGDARYSSNLEGPVLAPPPGRQPR